MGRVVARLPDCAEKEQWAIVVVWTLENVPFDCLNAKVAGT